MNKKILLFIIINLIIFKAFCNPKTIDYYGIISSEIDTNMAKMTSDLFYAQLSELQNYSINDKRNGEVLLSSIDESVFTPDIYSFYADISKIKKSDGWCIKIHIINNNNHYSTEKEYDSFYKILMESKASLQMSINDLLNNNLDFEKPEEFPSQKTQMLSSVSTDILSGTWSGEKFINKIVIMRSGRGFIIFDNGASMNIDIKIVSDNGSPSVLITQQGKANASFYPELPRNVALNAAKDAEPIKWQFSLLDENTLEGTKQTLTYDNNQLINNTINVSWSRKLN